MTIIIIGAGLTGLSTSFHLNKDHLIIEKENSIGGLCNTKEIKGFYFDYTAHLIHFKSPYCLKLLKKQLGSNLDYVRRNACIFLKNKYISYPFQINFTNLSLDIVKECVSEFIKAYYKPTHSAPHHFLEWILQNYGAGMAKHFFIPYNEKQWKFPLDEMDYKIITKYIPKTTLEDLFYALLNFGRVDYGYNVNFYYPQLGGIKSLAQSFINDEKVIKLNQKVSKINFNQNLVILKNVKTQKETKIKYNKLISTIPLPNLLKLIENLPSEIIKDLENFCFASVLCINYGIRAPNISDNHWIYFPEKKYIFHRISFPNNFSPNMAPKPNSSLSVEVSYNNSSELNINSISEKIVSGLLDLGFIKNSNDILFEFPMRIPFGYVIYKKDINYELIFSRIKEFLTRNNILSIGRFGSWNYSNMEDAILEGKNTAEYINTI